MQYFSNMESLLFKNIMSDILEKMNDSLHNFVLLSESSARANLIRIALGRNT